MNSLPFWTINYRESIQTLYNNSWKDELASGWGTEAFGRRRLAIMVYLTNNQVTKDVLGGYLVYVETDIWTTQKFLSTF